MLTADQIENQARALLEKDKDTIKVLEKLMSNHDELFDYFIECAKTNNYLVVSYILNTCFDNSQSRADFGNRKDSQGNTAYHYAAEGGYDEIIIILNDTRSYRGEPAKRFKFVEENNKGEKPLDLCCKAGNLSTFKLMWKRIDKPQHNPMSSLPYACISNNREIIETLLNHCKFKPNKPQLKKVITDVSNGLYGDKVRLIFEEKLSKKNNRLRFKTEVPSAKRPGIFLSEQPNKKRNRNESGPSETNSIKPKLK